MGNMLFTKPKGVRYVDMAKWIDDNFYSEDCDKDLAFKYMYLLALMLAGKAKYFSNQTDYDEYATFLALSTYRRLSDPTKIKIKSVLNYMKSIMYFRKVMYQNESFNEVIDPEFNQNWNPDLYREQLLRSLSSDLRMSAPVSIISILQGVPNSIKAAIPRQYKHDKVLFQRIYISAMLSFLSSITLPYSKELILKTKGTSASIDKYYNKYLTNDIILWHLTDEYKSTIILIINKVRKQLSEYINDTIVDYTVTEKMIDDIYDNALYGEANESDN